MINGEIINPIKNPNTQGSLVYGPICGVVINGVTKKVKTEKMVIASAPLLMEVLHFCLRRQSIAEIRVPA